MMISIDRVYNQLKRHLSYVSVVELAMILETNTSEVRQRLNELGDRVTRNEHDEWRATGDLVRKLNDSPLSELEVQERNELENTVSQAFYVAGQALKVLRDKKLYRETHSTFEAYVKEKFDFKKSAAYYLINASEVVENLKRPQIVEKNSQIEIEVFPTNESQCRPIAKLPPEKQREIWSAAVKRADGKVPSAKIVKEVVKEVVKEIRGEPKMKPEPKSERIVRSPGMETEYWVCFDRESYELFRAYKEKIGVASDSGAIKRLLAQKT